MIKKSLFAIGLLIALLFTSCMSMSDAYRMNYPNDPDMQQQMEKEFGNQTYTIFD